MQHFIPAYKQKEEIKKNMCKKFTQVFFKETKTQRGWKVKTRLDDCPYPMAIRWISSHDSNVTKCCLSDTQFFFFFFHFLSRFISLSQSVCPYPPILVFSFLFFIRIIYFFSIEIEWAMLLNTWKHAVAEHSVPLCRSFVFALSFYSSMSAKQAACLTFHCWKLHSHLSTSRSGPTTRGIPDLVIQKKKKKNASSLSSSKLPCTEEPLMDAGNPHPKLRGKKYVDTGGFLFFCCLFIF